MKVPRAYVRSPHPKVLDILVKNVRIIEGCAFAPIECARHGERKPLADKLRSGSASSEELTAAADLIEGKFKRKEKSRAYEALKRKAMAACVLALEGKWWPREDAVQAVVQNLGRSRAIVYNALQKHENDSECKVGKLVTPWPEVKYFGTVFDRFDRGLSEMES
jgi:hypothetical protein